jgi:hypothetical protein
MAEICRHAPSASTHSEIQTRGGKLYFTATQASFKSYTQYFVAKQELHKAEKKGV